ncbi:Phosphotyrosyl phosphatase activator, partial [Phlyctochytrium arcticum]
PTRQILTQEDLLKFTQSPSHEAILAFLQNLASAVRGKTLREDVHVSEPVGKILGVLDTLESWQKEISPVENEKSRFGNPAFQTWFDRLSDNINELVGRVIEKQEYGQGAIDEAAGYLLHAWGNRKRIDYGTGHELHFLLFLMVLDKLGCVTPEDYPALVLRVFSRYIQVMRGLQTAYWLEPAGSHGVWGLDDYHFLPFLFGASQLADHKHLRPKSIHSQDVISQYAADYMYLACVQFINSVKSASLRWHSPMLDDISGVKTWAKVAEGMIKMYRAEVLGKLPIMQHCLFGFTVPFQGSAAGTTADGDCCAHSHIYTALGQEFPSCCGIRVPSAIAAAAVAGDHERGSLPGAPLRPRPLPFD